MIFDTVAYGKKFVFLNNKHTSAYYSIYAEYLYR